MKEKKFTESQTKTFFVRCRILSNGITVHLFTTVLFYNTFIFYTILDPVYELLIDSYLKITSFCFFLFLQSIPIITL